MAKDGPASSEHKCCGIADMVEEATERRARKREKPQPWIMLKLTVGITLGIIGYAFYVYIGRLCLPMIRHDTGPVGGRATGVGFLVVFLIFGLLMLWSYAKVVCTSPGKAKNYVENSPRPLIENAVPTWWDPDPEMGMGEYQGAPTIPPASHAEKGRQIHHTPASSLPSSEEGPQQQDDDNAGLTDVLPPMAEARIARENGARQHGNGGVTHPNGDVLRSDMPHRTPRYTRKVPSTPMLLPEHRYCSRDGFVKPVRAHHCRACGTCVLRYDHHCPWIGQCVGARNHKFFVNFLEWAFLFCAWTFSTLLASVMKAGYHGTPDSQEIAIVALSALFLLFTLALLYSQIYMVCLNQTTVESLSMRRMKDRENYILSKLFARHEFGAKRRMRREWDREWGAINTEGHLWWLGSSKANWEAVMGTNVLGWFLPVGRSQSDGLSYPHNPRFDSEGRWRPRREWPRELQ